MSECSYHHAGPCRWSVALVWLAAALLQGPPALAQEAEEQRTFGGVFETLGPAQKALVVDLYERFAKTTGQTIDPATAYDAARLSVRTTFDAVTHALSQSQLTDAEGASLGMPLDLIEHLEAVHGKVRGAGGDRQFRIYVRLKPGARETLDRSQEFKRGKDNTIFHKGYPLNYRQQGGTPSMQISMTPNGQRADVDVDYRASKFPSALFNGHLTAANSDIRAGDNHGRHSGRWDGLQDWWRSLFGLVLTASDEYDDEEVADAEIPVIPRAGKKRIDIAVGDFLDAWLVERKPAQAMGYVSERALACLALEKDPEALDYGMAPVELLMGMRRVLGLLPPAEGLGDVTVGVRLSVPELTVVQQPRHAQFVLYGVPDAVAARFECANRGKLQAEQVSVKRRRQPKLSDFRYFGTSLYLKTPEQRGSTLLLLWTKEEGYWKLVSYEVEPDPGQDQGQLADLHEPPEVPPLTRVPGDPGLIEASTGFLESWLIAKDYDRAFSYLSPSSHACVDVFRPDEQPAGSPEAQARVLRERIAVVGDRFGRVARLEDAIDGPEAVDPQDQLVTHPREAAFTLLGLKDSEGVEADCGRQLSGAAAPDLGEAADRYGTYYASAFRVDTLAGEPAVFFVGWKRDDDGAWRIFAYAVETP